MQSEEVHNMKNCKLSTEIFVIMAQNARLLCMNVEIDVKRRKVIAPFQFLAKEKSSVVLGINMHFSLILNFYLFLY